MECWLLQDVSMCQIECADMPLTTPLEDIFKALSAYKSERIFTKLGYYSRRIIFLFNNVFGNFFKFKTSFNS